MVQMRIGFNLSDRRLMASVVAITVALCVLLTGVPTRAGSDPHGSISCAGIANAMDDDGIVTGESWVECSLAATLAINAANAASSVHPTNLSISGGTDALLTTGRSGDAAPPNDNDATSSVNTATVTRGAHDVSILALTLSIPANDDCLSFDLVFGTEDYPEFAGTPYADVFVAELDISDWSVAGTTLTAPHNFALDGSSAPITLNGDYFAAGSVVTNNGTEYDGVTPALRVRTPIAAGVHTLYLSIFDVGDSTMDSAAFVDHLRADERSDRRLRGRDERRSRPHRVRAGDHSALQPAGLGGDELDRFRSESVVLDRRSTRWSRSSCSARLARTRMRTFRWHRQHRPRRCSPWRPALAITTGFGPPIGTVSSDRGRLPPRSRLRCSRSRASRSRERGRSPRWWALQAAQRLAPAQPVRMPRCRSLAAVCHWSASRDPGAARCASASTVVQWQRSTCSRRWPPHAWSCSRIPGARAVTTRCELTSSARRADHGLTWTRRSPLRQAPYRRGSKWHFA